MTNAVSHAAKRLTERYGIALSQAEMRLLVSRLRKGEGVIVDKSATVERRLITVKDTAVIVVWSPSVNYIISVLPRRRNLPPLKRKLRSRDGRTKGEGKRPEREEWE